MQYFDSGQRQILVPGCLHALMKVNGGDVAPPPALTCPAIEASMRVAMKKVKESAHSQRLPPRNM